MRHSYFGKKLSRTKNERKRLLRELARSLIHYGRIRTTLAKAKAGQPLSEKAVTKAKRGAGGDKGQLMKVLADKSVNRLIALGKASLASRDRGFTQIVRLGRRAGDGSEEVILRFMDETFILPAKPVAPPKAPAKKEARPPKTKAP